ncbi:unnamed protein product, partial [Effrenium voratum]
DLQQLGLACHHWLRQGCLRREDADGRHQSPHATRHGWVFELPQLCAAVRVAGGQIPVPSGGGYDGEEGQQRRDLGQGRLCRQLCSAFGGHDADVLGSVGLQAGVLPE